MKRAVAVFFCFVFILCGCQARETTVEPVLSGISFDAKIDYGGYKCACSVKAYGGGVFTCSVLEPSVLKGAELNYNGEKLTLSFFGLKHEPDLPLPTGNIADILKTIIESAQKGLAEKNPQGHYNIIGRTGQYSYIVTVTESGLPIMITSEDMNFTAEITNAAIIG